MRTETTNVQRPHVRIVCAFDGEVNRTLTEGAVLFDGTKTTPSHPMGIIREAAHSNDADAPDFQPVLLSLQPFHGQLGRIARSNIRQLSRAPIHAGRKMVAVETGGKGTSLTTEFWLDPDRHHAIARIITLKMGRITDQTDIDHLRTPDGEFLPDRWIHQSFRGDGSLRRQVTATVNRWDFEIILDDEHFTMNFPTGTIVTDMRTEEDFLVQAENTKRPILANERNATYEQLLRSESGEALFLPTRGSLGYLRIAILLGVLSLLAGGGFLLRRSRI